MRQQHVATSEVKQPAIGDDLFRIAASAHLAAGVTRWYGASALADEVADALVAKTNGTAPTVTLEDVCVATLTKAAHRWATEVLSVKGRTALGFKPDARELLTAVQSGLLAGQLRQVFAGATTSCELNAALADVGLQGIDAERLCWAVIGFEAQFHIRLIWHEANKLCRSFPDRTPADLLGWGWQGLHVALRNFDPTKGFRFSTYACQRISGAIRDGVRSENPIPKRLLTFQRKVMRAEEDLQTELGRVPKLAEVAARLGQDDDALVILGRLQTVVSVDELTSGENATEIDQLIEQRDPADMAIAAAQRAAIDSALEELHVEDAEVARLVLFEQLSPAEVRERTGASPRQVRQRWAKSREHLQTALAQWR